MNPGRVGHFQKRIPGLRSRREAVLELFQSTSVREADENDLAAAGADFLDGRRHIRKTLFESFLHFSEEDIFWNERGRGRRREEREPNLLNSFRQFTARLSAFFPHSRPTFAIFRLKVGRKSWRDQGTGTIWNRQLIQQSLEA